MHVFELLVEAGVPRQNPCRHRENMQTQGEHAGSIQNGKDWIQTQELIPVELFL